MIVRPSRQKVWGESVRAIAIGMLLVVAGCNPIEVQSSLAKPAVLGRPYVAGAGDTVMDIKQTQSLPNEFGQADLLGRTRDSGRVIVRFVRLEGDQALFVRQDIVIQSNETSMSRDARAVPIYQTTSTSGSFGIVPVSATRTVTGVAYIPPAPSHSYPVQAGQQQIAAPVGGSVLVEGRRINVLRPVDGGIEYSVN